MTMFWKDSGWCCSTKKPLHQLDHMVLTHLYQPIIGATAVSLYLTMSYQSSLNRTEYSDIISHSYLLKLCALTYDQLLEARYLLEGVGLLSSYEKKLEDTRFFYEYALHPPLSPQRFFESDVLSLTLFNIMGKDSFIEIRKKILGLYTVKERAQDHTKKNITKSFQEVFGSFSPSQLKSAITMDHEIEPISLFTDAEEGKAPTFNDESQLETVKLRLSSLVDDTTWTEKLVAELNEIRFLYQLDEWDLIKALQNPYVTKQGIIDVERLRSYVKNEYRLRFGRAPVISPLSSIRATAPAAVLPEKEGAKKRSEEEKHFEQLEQMSPLELLSHYQQGAMIPSTDVELVETLVQHYGLPTGVINVLLEYVLLKYNYKLPRNLIEKIAGHWKRLGIKTVKKALEQARNEDWSLQKKQSENKSDKRQNLKKFTSRDKLPRSMEKQWTPSDVEESAETIAENRARIQEKLRMMNERVQLNKGGKEQTP
ncbi:DnaD domain protein [Hazenella sp. IB182357]|uniref:DnaD domain protein n=1 Tax=Polycladospora coralii TaxID=2771432 RepID=A0A926N9R6_9BACL|nr:DnaD domain protein [Polycladospora coralii]MBD1372801.1 DnaD domain protein [Polycladospora coralii]